MSNQKFYITTPIYYVNDVPHIGHAYTAIAVDTLTRYHKIKSQDVFFLTGTDENSQKNVEAALAAGEKSVQAYVDKMSAIWQQTWDSLGLINNDFIRTTEERHKKGVLNFFDRVYKKGDIYKGKYKGLYCKGCEAFVSEIDLACGLCPIHKIKPEAIEEENYFFKLKKYEKELLAHLKANPDFIQPESRRNEVINYISYHLEDFSMSRPNTGWGIPLPIDKKQVFYVWFDALINYLTGIGYGWDEKKFDKYWPVDLHLIGKDIIKFHCVYWPAMLMSAGLPLPKRIFAHGFFTINGEKISKSLRNIIDPTELAAKYGIDAVRYFLLREISFGSDGDFSIKRFEERYTTDLANGLGNLVSRVLGMTEKYFKGKVPKIVSGRIEHIWNKYEGEMERLELHNALATTWDLIKFCDTYIDQQQPWVLVKTNKEQLALVIYTLLETIRHIAWMILPFMPDTADKILEQLGLNLNEEKKKTLNEAKIWETVGPGRKYPEAGLKEGTKIKKGGLLFPKLT